MDLYQVFGLVGIPSVISGLVALLIQRSLKVRDERQEEIRAKSEEMELQNRAIMMGLQAILRDRLLQGYRYYAGKGWADYEDRANLENLWFQYHALGANGIMDEYRKRFLALPVAPGDGTAAWGGGGKEGELESEKGARRPEFEPPRWEK